MTDKKSILLSHFNHRGLEVIRVDFAYDSEIVNTLRKLSIDPRWSRIMGCWHVTHENDNLEKLKECLEKVAEVIYIPAGQDAESLRMKIRSTFITDLFPTYSLFISYSFKDKTFVTKLNEILCDNGVQTFLWEKDAPYGESLKDIMFENVHKYDRVLFVASENSLKSQACHYELSQAREKQDKLWKTVLFPIHIDSFLFDLRKETIRPIEKADEYWMNICELRRINSLDFTEVAANFDNDRFKEKIQLLLNNLRKDK